MEIATKAAAGEALVPEAETEEAAIEGIVPRTDRVP